MDLRDRGRALENEFFRKEEAKKIAALRERLEKAETRERLRAASGIDDNDVLDKLVEIGISAETVTAMSLVPLVYVAWADELIQARERHAILQGARGKGIEEGSGEYELLAGWLNEKPGTELFTAWSAYVEALAEQLTAEQLQIVRRQVIDRARAVAAAAGGFLGLKTISDSEERALARVEGAFHVGAPGRASS